MNRSFTILEILVTIVIISIIITLAIPKKNIGKLQLAKEQLILHLKYTRNIAMLDNKYDHNDEEWYKTFWRIKFERCDASYGGAFYSIFWDKNKKGHASKEEVLKDPLTGKLVYASNCNPNHLTNYQSNVLLKYHFGIENVDISCNETSSIGQIIFDNEGNVYSSISDERIDKYKIIEKCVIKLSDKYGENEIINIEPSGYIY
jgi:hypothetical protein